MAGVSTRSIIFDQHATMGVDRKRIVVVVRIRETGDIPKLGADPVRRNTAVNGFRFFF